MATLKLAPDPSPAKKAIVVIFDVGEFSKFCNHPDRHSHVPRFLSGLFEKLDTLTISDFDYAFSRPSMKEPKIVAPDFIKCTGDGALMLWTSDSETRFDQEFRDLLVATMRRFQQEFSTLVPTWEANWCMTELPRRIRFGITMGSVFPLHKAGWMFDGDILDYAGYCINLACRLQSHCREVGFVIQKCVAPKLPHLKCYSALGMKGAAEEPVWLFDSDFKNVENNPGYWQTKFRSL
jgi:class 3 adenylate cyclase